MSADKICTKEKIALTNLNKYNHRFRDIIQKLSIEDELNFEEKSFILASAIVFLNEYENDKRYKSYAEFGYYIILKYSLTYKDYQPLYDFSTNFGFYPISNYLIENQLITPNSFDDIMVKIQLKDFRKDNYTETLEQHINGTKFIEDSSSHKGYIAPTSFGKSSLIVDFIKHNTQLKRIGIIVPTKSLLRQTYRLIKNSSINYKLLIHDEMYDDDDKFIGIFTQERALRLLKKNKGLYFDALIIDEAHNLFKSPKKEDNRSVLLNRLIRLNKHLNPEQNVTYLSPLVTNAQNLSYDSTEVSSHTIFFNVKCPEYYEYSLNGDIIKHNRFLMSSTNPGYTIGKSDNWLDYIIEHKQKKNFIYLRSPKKIEQLANNISAQLNVVESSEIQKIIRSLKKIIHEDFYIIKHLEKGLIYLHGRIPDIIKEYLEHKFAKLPEIKFAIANSVILEGINLPIDSLFIMNTYALTPKDLTNLIGRVNRLNEVFKHKNLSKLIPSVHFVNNKIWNPNGTTFFNKIETLRSRVLDDKVENPTLENFNSGKLKPEKLSIIEEIVYQEDFFLNSYKDKSEDSLKQYLIESGVSQFYDNIDNLVQTLEKIIRETKPLSSQWKSLNIIDKVHAIFIEPFIKQDITENIVDFELERLKEPKARDYYSMFLDNRQHSLKRNINKIVKYLLKRKKSINPKEHIYYVGRTYGEIPYDSTKAYNASNNVAIDITTKNKKDLVNIAIVKLKMEDDFVSYKLNKLIIFLHDYEMISDDEYKFLVYGTTDEHKIALTKYGLSIGLVTHLEENDQIKNLEFNENNNLQANSELLKYLKTLDDFEQFEIKRFLN